MSGRLETADLLTADVREAAARWLGSRDDDALARIAWAVLVEPGDGVAGGAIGQLGARDALDLVASPGGAGTTVAQAVERWRTRWDPRLLLSAIAAADRKDMRLVTPSSAEWPRPLDDLGPHAPVALWVRGDPALLPSSPSVGVVGARAVTPYGEHATADIVNELAETGIAIVSGAAYGVDGIAHRAALRVGGTTVAFLAGGADRVYPAGHANLLAQIAETGAVAAECAPGTTPTRWRFLARNRLIAALSDATLIVEAGARSGSINTAGHAAALGRPLGAVPGPITSSTSAGCHRVLREYDATCITGAADVREMLGDVVAGRAREFESTEAVRVADALTRRRARSVEEIAQRSGMAVDDVVAALGILLLEGRAAERADGWVSAV
ncbi:DNA-processing protein DprA [Microbacterium sp. G2-8]|uniref:DNA-processing protein DprA n=1 Tax=Microbacterium sp. G2-8 TaxID=2842454 RepID=UPI001C8936D3|nr:DNA-processing protein DprA [Microbacterium sp. G2-8]